MPGGTFGWLAASIMIVSAPSRSIAHQAVEPATPVAAPASAQADDDVGLFDDQRVQRGDDEEKTLRFDSRLDLEVQHLHRRERGRERGREPGEGGGDITRLLSEVRMELTYRPDDALEAFASVEIAAPFEREDGRALKGDGRFELREAYLSFKDIVPDIEIRVGRQEFEDGREWLYDARLDGARAVYAEGGLTLEAAVGRVGLLPVDLLNPGRDDRTDNFLLRAEYAITDDWEAAAYVLAQEDRTAADASPTFFGVQSGGTLFGGLSHWLELSLQRGRVGLRKSRANAVDAGLVYRFAAPLRPALIVAYARGSGGGNAAVDRDFQQTGFQDNEDRLTGLGRIVYYGELLAPTLGNLSVLTLGAGLRPSRSTSFEVIAHRYRQVALGDNAIRDSPFDARPNGTSRDLGRGIDLVGAIRLSRVAGLETKLGYFDPGRAFANGTKDAFFFDARFVYNF